MGDAALRLACEISNNQPCGSPNIGWIVWLQRVAQLALDLQIVDNTAHAANTARYLLDPRTIGCGLNRSA